MEITFLKFCQKAMIQSEVGLECKTPHLHGAIWFKINPLTNKPFKHRWNELKLPETIHWEKFKGSDEDVITYCSKGGEDGFDGVYRWSFGMPKPLKCITTLYPYQKECLDYCMNEPDGQTVWWVYEGIGGEGKSAFCRYMIINHNSIVIQGGKLADIMNIIFNTDMSMVETIIIDIPRCHKNAVSYAAIECILNGCITNTKYETGRKIFNPPNILIFSNFKPIINEETLSIRRWKVFTIENKHLKTINLEEENDF